MVTKALTSTLFGVNGALVEVEAFISRGLPAFEIVGLASTAVKESKDRVRAALLTNGYQMPPARITVNLSPADMKKEGTAFDLPIAIVILQESLQEKMNHLNSTLLLGELSLNGELNHVQGCLPMVISALRKGIKNIIVPKSNATELSCLEGANIFTPKNLSEVVAHLNGKQPLEPLAVQPFDDLLKASTPTSDLKYVKGQYLARFALEVAAAGGHNLLLVGTPGSGKTMLSRCLPSILPPLTFEEALQTTQIHSCAGMLPPNAPLICERPFRSPHHSASTAAIVGGGRLAKPGEISLAHNGVLFLDEFPQFDKKMIEALRQPLEDGVISVARVGAKEDYPASFMLVASMNPCPCGNFGSKIKTCTCSPNAIHQYLSRISGPILDRMDIQVEMDAVGVSELESPQVPESSEKVAKRVLAARQMQQERYKDKNIHCNAQLTSHMLSTYCNITAQSKVLLAQAVERFGLSLRGYNRVLKVARTLADLARNEQIQNEHIIKALQLRNLEGKFWKN